MHLDDIGADGMVYIGSFPSYMTYNERKQTLTSQNHDVYAIGDKIDVLVASVDVDERKVDLLPQSDKRQRAKLRKMRDKILERKQKAQEGKEPLSRRLSLIR